MAFLETHFNTSQRLVNRAPMSFKRYLYKTISWKEPLLFVIGMRGVGKTTLLLQYLKENYADKPTSALYLTADDINLSNKRLVDIADRFRNQYAGELLIIDEVHKYPNWNQELKNIYDLQPDLKVIASGSSSLDILKGQYDLSRRSVVYKLKHLSLREYINFSCGLKLESLELADILSKHSEASKEIIDGLRKNKLAVLERFQRYLKQGAYPYFKDKDEFTYQQQVVNAITKVLYEDIPSMFKVSSQSSVMLQRILNAITTSEPYQPNVESLSRNLSLAKETVYNYLDYLEASGIIHFLPQANAGIKAVRKPAKIYLANPTLYHALGQVKGLEVKLDTLRESFFLSQLSNFNLRSHKTVDFELHQKPPLRFEIGGQGKSKKQIKGLTDSYLALDIEYGVNKTIPLWLFGFLY